MTIPKVNFYLKNIKSIEPTLIYLQIKFNNERITLTASDKILPKEWDFIKQRAIVSKNKPSNSDVNSWLNKIEFEFDKIFRDLKMNDAIPNSVSIKSKLEVALNLKAEKVVKTPEFIDFVQEIIISHGTLKCIGTIKCYKSTLVHLKEYSIFKNIAELKFEDITLDFYNSFSTYISVTKNTSLNNVGKHIKNIKFFLNEATDRGYNKNLDFKKRTFKTTSEYVEKIFLNKKEIELFRNAELDSNKLDVVRDYFILSCCTGLRYSDFNQMTKKSIVNNCLEVITAKTKEKVHIPIKQMALDIFEKYNYNMPKIISNQKFNEYLKIIGEKAGIDNAFFVTRTVANKKVNTEFKKYELITCHTARRSFASNAILEKVPSDLIRKITGHKTEAAFKLYIRVDKLEYADLLKDYSYFK